MLAAGIFFLTACNNGQNPDKDSVIKAGITEKPFGAIAGEPVTQYILTNPAGMQISILNYGGTVTNIFTLDRNKEWGDVVLGFDSLPDYLQKNNPYIGCLVGRYANRISKGKFVIDTKTYQLPINNGPNTLHGGLQGFDKVIWQTTKLSDSSLQLNYTSKDGEEGFPGNMKVQVVYTLTGDNALRIDYAATTDQPTPVNLTNHTYFNLSAGKQATILDHQLMLKADQFTEVDDQIIPTGKLPDVKGTVMDFNLPKSIREDIGAVKGGYDHNWVLNKTGSGLETAATLYDSASGRHLEVLTTQPGVQCYTGNFLNGTLKGKNSLLYVQHAGLCLETQHYPDSPNQPSFPNSILRPGETYKQTTVFRFSVK